MRGMLVTNGPLVECKQPIKWDVCRGGFHYCVYFKRVASSPRAKIEVLTKHGSSASSLASLQSAVNSTHHPTRRIL